MAQIKSFGVVQTAKFSAVMYFIITAIFIIPVALIVALAGMFSGSAGGAFGGLAGGLLMLLLPLFYAAMGFVFVAIGCLVYNFIAKIVGGIELEIE